MATTIRLDVVSAEGKLFSGMVYEVSVPGVMGELGILPHHAQLISPLRAGELRYKPEEGGLVSLFVSGGIVEVQPYVVTVLADTAIRADDLDEVAAQEAKKRAEDALLGKDPTCSGYKALQAERKAAKAQIEMLLRISKSRR